MVLGFGGITVAGESARDIYGLKSYCLPGIQCILVQLVA